MRPIVPIASLEVNGKSQPVENRVPEPPTNGVPPPPPSTLSHPFLQQSHSEKSFFLYHLTPSERPDKVWAKKPSYDKVTDLMTAGESQYELGRLGALEVLPFPIGQGDYFYDLGRHRDPRTHTLTDTAAAAISAYKSRLSSGYSLGYYFKDGCQRFFFDLDGCRNPETGVLTSFGQREFDRFNALGAYTEVSPSGTGLHIVGGYRGPRPPHANKNEIQNLELYTADRGMAIGTPFKGTGSPDTDCTEALNDLIATLFQPKSEADRGKRSWTNEPEEGFRGPTDRLGLMGIFLRGRQGKVPTNQQLWDGDQEAIAQWRPEPNRGDNLIFNPTAADMLMASELNFYSGNNFELTLQMMESSPYAALRLDKWKDGVLRRETIPSAHKEEVYQPGYTSSDSGSSVSANASPVNRAGRVQMPKASSLRAKQQKWLWKGWLPQGAFTMFAGMGGIGKSQVSVNLAAVVSTGGVWPDGTRCEHPGDVVIWNSEDAVEETIVPRLIAAGANMDRIHIITGGDHQLPFVPSKDLGILKNTIEELGLDVKLMILDPIAVAVDAKKGDNGSIRHGLQPLLDFTAKLKCNLLGIGHFGKPGQGKSKNPTDRVLDSVAWVNAARNVLVAAQDRNVPNGDCVVVNSKINIAKQGSGYKYRIESTSVVDPETYETITDVARIQWLEAVSGTSEEILSKLEPEVEDGRSKGKKLREVIEYLLIVLGPGPKPQSVVDKNMPLVGTSTLYQAKAELGIISERRGNESWWILPQDSEGRKRGWCPA